MMRWGFEEYERGDPTHEAVVRSIVLPMLFGGGGARQERWITQAQGTRIRVRLWDIAGHQSQGLHDTVLRGFATA